jgi:hypothetical protein
VSAGIGIAIDWADPALAAARSAAFLAPFASDHISAAKNASATTRKPSPMHASAKNAEEARSSRADSAAREGAYWTVAIERLPDRDDQT